MLETNILVVMETLLSSAPVLFAVLSGSQKRKQLYSQTATELELKLPFQG